MLQYKYVSVVLLQCVTLFYFHASHMCWRYPLVAIKHHVVYGEISISDWNRRKENINVVSVVSMRIDNVAITLIEHLSRSEAYIHRGYVVTEWIDRLWKKKKSHGVNKFYFIYRHKSMRRTDLWRSMKHANRTIEGIYAGIHHGYAFITHVQTPPSTCTCP